MDTMKMSRIELVQWLEDVKAGKIKLKKNIWMFDKGQLYVSVKDTWHLVDKLVFDKLAGKDDIFITDTDQDVTPYDMPGIMFLKIISKDSQRKALESSKMFTLEEIEENIRKLPSVLEFADFERDLIRKLQNE